MISPSDQLLFDASPLLHSAKADRLDVLGDLVRGFSAVTTRAVIDEIDRNHTAARAAVDGAWLSVVEMDSLETLVAFGEWRERPDR